jgi:hypothetical protein
MPMVSQHSSRVIGPGTILVKIGTPLPEPLKLESDSAATHWACIANNLNGRQLAEQLDTAGWTFFYMAGSIRTAALGFQRQNMVNAALRRSIASAESQRCNCLAIDDVALHSFLGMSYVRVSAHSRHIQQGMTFSGQ